MKHFLTALDEAFSQERYGENPTELYEPIRYIMGLGGKRLRPVLTLISASMLGADWQKALRPAMSVEVFHNFTLVHDDIMDKAPLRRGHATVHARWSEPVAILSGDVMLVKAYELLMEVADQRFKYALRRFNETACGVCEGQQMDMNFEQMAEVSIPMYIEMIRLKTSVLLGFALELGGIVAQADEAVCDLLRQIGEDMGIGFQIKDDILDVYGDPAKFGKQVGGDILSNKKTYLLIKAIQQAQGAQQANLEAWLAATDFVPQEKVQAVTQLYNELGIRQVAEQAMNDYFEKAYAGMNQLPVDETQRKILVDFADWLIARES
jgi:geranylgeranyl diphosphate synthase, type II